MLTQPTSSLCRTTTDVTPASRTRKPHHQPTTVHASHLPPPPPLSSSSSSSPPHGTVTSKEVLEAHVYRFLLERGLHEAARMCRYHFHGGVDITARHLRCELRDLIPPFLLRCPPTWVGTNGGDASVSHDEAPAESKSSRGSHASKDAHSTTRPPPPSVEASGTVPSRKRKAVATSEGEAAGKADATTAPLTLPHKKKHTTGLAPERYLSRQAYGEKGEAVDDSASHHHRSHNQRLPTATSNATGTAGVAVLPEAADVKNVKTAHKKHKKERTSAWEEDNRPLYQNYRPVQAA